MTVKLPRVRIQSLPPYTAAKPPTTPTGRNTPTVRTVEVGYAEADQPAIYRAMVEALVFNLSFIQGAEAGPADLHLCESAGMLHNAGRCLWSWSSIPSPYFEEGLAGMQAKALRSSALFPSDMRCLSPRFACLLLMTGFSKIERDIERALSVLGIRARSKVQLAFAVSCLDYGSPQLLPYARLESLPERNGYNEVQSAVLALADAGTLPFSHYLLTRGIYPADQAKRISEARGACYADLTALAEHLSAPRTKVPDVQELVELLMAPPSGVFEKAADAVMLGRWSDLRLGELPGDPDEDLAILMARAIIRRLGCEGRSQRIGPEYLLGLAVLTGLSPAAFARHAVEDFRRRGTTYVTAADLDELADLVEQVTISSAMQSQRRGVLVRELRGLADMLGTVHAGMKDWEVELPQKLIKCWAPKNLAHEWTNPTTVEEPA